MKTQKILKRLPSIKIVLSVLLLLLSFKCSLAQLSESELSIPILDISQSYNKENALDLLDEDELLTQKNENAQSTTKAAIESDFEKSKLEKSTSKLIDVIDEIGIKEKALDDAVKKNFSEKTDSNQTEEKEKFHWKPALIQSGIFLGIQHGFRMTQKKTRRELGGPFFRDWSLSVKRLRGWKDPDNLFTNYVAHPLQGGLTGRIFVNNSDRAKKQEFGSSKKYWESRFKAMVWSAAWSTQFELGPISEASLGNVGIRDKRGRPTMAWGDLVVTPTIGTGVLIAEDAIDKYILKNWLEKKIKSKFTIRVFRVLLTPTTSFSNVLRIKLPSQRDYRPL